MSDITQGLTPAELYMACTMRKETRGMGYPERLDASTLTQEDVDAYRRSYGDLHAARPTARTLPTRADAQAAIGALDASRLEAALCAAGDYVNAGRRGRNLPQMTGTEIGALLGALALGIRAYTENEASG